MPGRPAGPRRGRRSGRRRGARPGRHGPGAPASGGPGLREREKVPIPLSRACPPPTGGVFKNSSRRVWG
eukprot:6873541-Pyramimonas_sp.AAC.1